MKPVRQRIRHEPQMGRHGDCHRAAVASLLELDIAQVPHFADGAPDPVEFQARVEAWLRRRNLTTISVPFTGTMQAVVAALASCAPEAYWLLSGRRLDGTMHVVVGHGGAVRHDPAVDWPGAVLNPCPDGCYWVSFLVAHEPHLFGHFTVNAGGSSVGERIYDLIDLARLAAWGLAQAVGWRA